MRKCNYFCKRNKKGNTMKKTKFVLFVWIMTAFIMQVSASSSLTVYPAPQGADLNSDFTVQVRQGGQAWKDVPVYLIMVDEVRGTKHCVERSSMATFDFSGSVEVKVKWNKGRVDSARVRPLSYGIPAKVEGDEVSFTLERPCNLSVEVNGDIFHNLQLFANPVETDVPDRNDPDVLYYGPGVHTPEGGAVKVPSGKTLYLAGGALLKGRILVEGVRDVVVRGRGVVDYRVKGGIRVANSRNVLVEGLVATQCATGGSDSVTIRNVKVISYYGWGDGMNVFASNNVLFDGVFCRNSDDCTTVYGTRLGFEGGCRNVTMQNSTLWADVAHPIFIGIHGNAEQPEVLENLNYVNIDILDHREKQLNYQGCMSINAGDNNIVRNVRFENIRVEDFREGQLLNLRIFYNKKYCKAPGRGIENVLFKDITYDGNRANLSIIEGYDEERTIRGVRFENLRINGQLITDDMPGKPAWYQTGDMAGIYIGPHVEDVTFTK